MVQETIRNNSETTMTFIDQDLLRRATRTGL